MRYERSQYDFLKLLITTIAVLIVCIFLFANRPRSDNYTGLPVSSDQYESLEARFEVQNATDYLDSGTPFFRLYWHLNGDLVRETTSGALHGATDIDDTLFLTDSYIPYTTGTLRVTMAQTVDSASDILRETVRIDPPVADLVTETTMYYLATSIARSPTTTWTVTEPIIRSSSAEYETLLYEVMHNQAKSVTRYHIVVYDQATNISNYYQKGWHYYVATATEAAAIMARAVPDGDTTRYYTQSD